MAKKRVSQRDMVLVEKYLCLGDQGNMPPPAVAGRARLYYGDGLASKYLYAVTPDPTLGTLRVRINDPRRGSYDQLVINGFATIQSPALVATRAGNVLGMGFVEKIAVVLTDQFVGTGITALTLRVYNSETLEDYITGFDLLQATPTPIVETFLPVNDYVNNSYQIVAEIVATGANLDQLTAGSFKIFAKTLEEASLGNYPI